MSRAFVKETDTQDDLPPGRRAPRQQPCYITRYGYDVAQREHAELARQLHGRRLDALEFDAQEEFRRQRARWHELADLLAAVLPVDPLAQPGDEVRFGATVTLTNAAGEEHTVTLVGEDEVALRAGRVSWRSPLGQAVLGARLGEEVVCPRPAGAVRLTVRAIAYPAAP